MSIQRIAQVFGIVFLLVGILGFITSGSNMEADPEMADKLLGLFPVNAVHNGVHLGFGIWGLLAARSFDGARNYAIVAGAIYALLVIVGVLVPNGFGLVPLGGHDIWLHGLFAGALLVSGFSAKRTTTAAV
ncbi:MAG TPA: DUF4383 domain-containing protein [Longimicrobiales bacterium]|nr:DUF4383 domain-containing protein [Longimicrobiales bacterium]